MEREAQFKTEMASQNLDQKSTPYATAIDAPKSIDTKGALTPRNRNDVSVLVASPNAADFNTHVLPLMQAFEGVDYTVTLELGALTIEQMLEYDVVFTFNVTKWEVDTGTDGIGWSDKLGDFITAGGYLVEAEFVNGYDDWGLLGGSYITNNMSPFTKSTMDRPTDTQSLGEVLIPDHPIMSGVTSVTTDYFIQNVTARDDATLIAKWSNVQADPLVAVYDNIVAFNFGPIASSGQAQSPGLGGDGYKMIHNAIVWLYNNQADPASPAAPTNLVATAGDLGALTASVSWNNPNETFGGDPLTELTSVTLMVNDEVVETINNPTIGAAETYSYTATEAGAYVFTVFATNSVGDGPATSQSIWIGEDAPGAPGNVVLEAITDGGKITWEAPTVGIQGGYINPANTVYTVIRMPDTVVAEDITETEYEDVFNPSIGNYQYKVVASNTIGEGGEAVSNVALLGAEGILFYEPFDGVAVGSLPAGWVKEGIETAAWSVQNSQVAGGTAPEMRLYWSPQFDGLSRLVTNSFGTQGKEQARLKFKHYLSNFAASGNTLAAQVSFDGGEWENIWEEELTATFGPMEMELYINIPPTATEMRLGWEFNGDVYNISNYNLDNIIVEPVVDNDLAAISISGNSTPTVGEATTYTITIQNSGTVTQTDYSVKLMKEGGIELASVDGVAIDFAETETFALAWTPTAADEGPGVIYGEVVLATDEILANNKTADYAVIVQPAGIIAITIGEGTNYPSVRLPFDFFWKNSFAQTIYYADEINLSAGAITSIAYTNNFSSNLEGKEIKVWIGETDLDNLNGGWVPLDQLTEVFNGTMNFPSGENTIVIPFENPYIYGGGNLVIYTNRVWEDAYASSTDRFYGTLDSDSKRTRYIYADGTGPLNPENPGAGTANDWHPNITIFMSTAGLAEIEGKVVDAQTDDPVEGVKVETQSAKARTFTNEDGEFGFMLLAGTYNFSFEKFGYISKTVEGIELEADDLDITSLANVQLTPVPQYEVTGTVKGNDNLFLEDAVVTLVGYDSYEVLTNAQGEFTFASVYEGTYSISVSLDGYEGYTAEGIEVSADLQLDLIELTELIITPSSLAVDVFNQNQGEALFTWSAGEVEFRYDDGTVDGQLGFQNGTVNNVIGAVHHRNAKLKTVSWFLTSEGGPHATVKVWISGLNAAGEPNTNDILFSQEGVPNTDMEWNTLELPEIVEAPNGFFIGVGTTGFVGLATDTGTDTQWPFVPNANYGGSMSTGEFFSFESLEFEVNALIRATGTDLGGLKFDAKSEQSYTQVIDLVYIKNEESFVTETSALPSTRAFTGYEVYLNDMDTPVATAVQANEYLFTNVPEGNHVAGVKAVHTTGASEIMTVNFSMDFGVNVTVNISTNSGDSPEGAEVTLMGEEHDYSGVANADGKVEFPVVYRGTYNLTVSLANHEVHEEQNVNLQDDKVFDVELEEIVVVPYGLMVEQLNDRVDVKFSWNNFFGFTDDFESYEDFIIADIGEYTLYDGDGSATYTFSGIDFPNATYTGSYIIFNPSQTNPPVDSDAIQPHSGDKFIACFAATAGPNNDWLITPQIGAVSGMKLSFWAKTYMDYGLEKFRVAISTTDTNPASFEFITEEIQAPLADWAKFEYDLSAYAGQNIYAAIVCVSDDVFVFMVDDLEVSMNSKMGDNVLGYTQTTYAHSNVQNTSKAFLGYKVFLDGQLVSGETPISAEEFVFENLKGQETYSAGVKSVYSSGESEMQSLIFTTEGDGTSVMDNLLSTITAYPNPFDNRVTITNAELVKRVIVTNALGQRVLDVKLNGRDYINTESLGQGVYFMLLEGENGHTTLRKMVKN